MDISSLITALTGTAALIFGTYQWSRGRRDQAQQQAVANKLEEREQNLDELREMAAQRKADYERVVTERDHALAELARTRTIATTAVDQVDLLRGVVVDETAKASGAKASVELHHLLDNT